MYKCKYKIETLNGSYFNIWLAVIDDHSLFFPIPLPNSLMFINFD